MGTRNGIPQQSPTMSLGQRIVEAREAKGWSRKRLADESGVPYPTLAGLESSDQKSSTATPMLAAALNVNALWLATGKGSRDLNVKVGGPEMPHGSQPAQLNPALLARAIFWLAVAEGRDYTPAQSMRRAERLIALYQAVEANGGDLSGPAVVELVEAARREVPKGGVVHGKSSKRAGSN